MLLENGPKPLSDQLAEVFKQLAEAEFSLPGDNQYEKARPVSDIPRILQTWASSHGRYYDIDEVGMQNILQPIRDTRSSVTPEIVSQMILADVFRPVMETKVRPGCLYKLSPLLTRTRVLRRFFKTFKPKWRILGIKPMRCSTLSKKIFHSASQNWKNAYQTALRKSKQLCPLWKLLKLE